MDKEPNGFPTMGVNQPSQSPPILDPKELEAHTLDILRDAHQTVYSLTELLAMKVSDIPCLVEGLFPKVGLVALVGSSDVGKSTLLRQLALCVVGFSPDFLGFPLNVQHQEAIYISTEDDETAIAYLASRQANRAVDIPPNQDGLRFMFDTSEVLEQLATLLSEQPADLVVVDCFADLYGDDGNQAGKVRGFLNGYSVLAQRHKCLFVFLHHTGKGKESDVPNKNNAVGSHAFEAKMRMVVELRKDQENPDKKHFCIVKGNYLPESMKRKSIVLEQGDDYWYQPTGETTAFSELAKPAKPNEADNRPALAWSMLENGMLQKDIASQFGVQEGTVSKWLKPFKDRSSEVSTESKVES